MKQQIANPYSTFLRAGIHLLAEHHGDNEGAVGGND